MSYVVVLLADAKMHLVVKEDWIKDLNSAKTKNYGKNCNQPFLMFWSGTDGKPNDIPKENIHFDQLEIKTEFLPTCEGVGYRCYVLQFEGM